MEPLGLRFFVAHVRLTGDNGGVYDERRSFMSDVFLLGSGFSKAISNEMPVTKELSQEVLKYKFREVIPPEIRCMIEEDFEKALSFLVSEKPWVSESENLRHKALFLDLTKVIRAVFWLKSTSPLAWVSNRPPAWLDSLIAYWHKTRSVVITLNYDTLIERVASRGYELPRPPIPTTQLYPIRLTPAVLLNRSIYSEPTATGEPMETFKLFKLHGSVNWFYSGRANFSGEELFCLPCNGGLDAVYHMLEGVNVDNADARLLSGKPSLIIPPTLDKSVFFQHEALRSMWFQAGEAIKQATKVICLGYSLPGSDLTMAQFLRDCAPPTPIGFEIVDLSERDELESKVDHFARIIGKNRYEFRQTHSGDECIQKFVIANLIADFQEGVRAVRSCHYATSTP